MRGWSPIPFRGWGWRMADGDRGIPDRSVIVFDGHCVFCSANARFVLRNDRRGHFRLAAMQGKAGAAIMQQCSVDPEDPDTLIVIDGGKVFRDRAMPSSKFGQGLATLGARWRCSAPHRAVGHVQLLS